MARRRPKRGDVFQIPAGDERVAYGQVLSEEEGVFMHLVVFEGLHDAADEHDVEQVMSAPAELYAWTDTRPLRKRWRVVDNRPINGDALPPVEFVEMAAPEEFQVIDYDGNVLRPATAEELENAPFRTMVSTDAVEEAVEAWHGLRPWEDKHLSLRPWDERNAERDDEAARLLRRFRGLDEAPAAPNPESAEKIHYFAFDDEAGASAAEQRLRRLGDVRVDVDDSDGRSWLLSVTTTVAASPGSPELERLARELGGEYDGSETEVS
jgi:Immunity protein 26